MKNVFEEKQCCLNLKDFRSFSDSRHSVIKYFNFYELMKCKFTHTQKNYFTFKLFSFLKKAFLEFIIIKLS